jgi:hypothetical protein
VYFLYGDGACKMVYLDVAATASSSMKEYPGFASCVEDMCRDGKGEVHFWRKSAPRGLVARCINMI